ncbi:hypothetical protein TNCV_2970981 [Trichonephila clavipes]|nr:hypothetical protein TNCV_2970981 [Trichonephila clavipes]
MVAGGYLCVPFGPRFSVDGWQEVSAADKEWRVYLLDPHPDAVALYSGCTPGKRPVWFLPAGLCGGWRHARMKFVFRACGSYAAVPWRVIIRGDAFGCKTQFIVRVLSSALGGIRALTRKSESGKERERKRGVAFVENLTHAQIALKVLARVSTARNCSRSCARTDRNEKLMRS